MNKEYEQEMWLRLKNGSPDWPRYFPCPNCGTSMRRRPGPYYGCSECGGSTTLEVAEPHEKKKISDLAQANVQVL